MMAAFTQMRAQMLNMSKMMRLSTSEGQQDQKLMQELVDSASRKVAPGMVRRRKVVTQPEGLGFGSVKAK